MIHSEDSEVRLKSFSRKPENFKRFWYSCQTKLKSLDNKYIDILLEFFNIFEHLTTLNEASGTGI